VGSGIISFYSKFILIVNNKISRIFFLTSIRNKHCEILSENLNTFSFKEDLTVCNFSGKGFQCHLRVSWFLDCLMKTEGRSHIKNHYY
jgi:hypothetical protein